MDNKALGKGLSALIPEKHQPIENKEVASVETALVRDNTLQPRTHYDPEKLEELKASIREKGVLQPILVRPSGQGYEVVAGERRLKAARALGLERVPVHIKAVTDREALVLALVENVQREDLNAVEEAQAFKRLMDEFQFTQEQVAASVGKERSTVSNTLRLLKLPAAIQKGIEDGRISQGHARALITIEDQGFQLKLFEQIVDQGLPVRAIEKLVKEAGQSKAPIPLKTPAKKDRDVEILEEELQKALGTKVQIAHRKNKGKLVIEYYSLDDLDRIIAILKR